MIFKIDSTTGKRFFVDDKREEAINYVYSRSNEDLLKVTEIFITYSFPVSEKLLRNVVKYGSNGIDRNAEEDAREWAKSANYPEYLLDDVVEKSIRAIHTDGLRSMYSEISDAIELYPFRFRDSSIQTPDAFGKMYEYDKKKQILQLKEDFKTTLVESCAIPVSETILEAVQPLADIVEGMRELDRKGFRIADLAQLLVGCRYQEDRRPSVDESALCLAMLNHKEPTSDELKLNNPDVWQTLNQAENPDYMLSLYRSGAMAGPMKFNPVANPGFDVDSVLK